MNVLDTRHRDLPPVAVERLLLEAARRAERVTQGRLAVVLHLSRLHPPAPRPHHCRIARALLQDTAARHDGQVFVLRNEDMVLLCRATPPGQAGLAMRQGVPEPETLPEIMGRLLRVDTPNGAELVSVWPLETQAGQLLAYAAARVAQSGEPLPIEEDVVGQPGMVDAVANLVGTAALSDLLQRQTAILLPGGADPQGPAPRPLYQEVTFSLAALEARIATTCHASADPFLFRHLAGRMDQRMLEALRTQIGSGGPLDVSLMPAAIMDLPATRPPVLHLNLTLPGVLSSAFARFTDSCVRTHAPLGIEISFIEAAADPRGFARARAMIAAAGFALVIDGVSHHAMLISRPWALQADFLKLDWSPRLVDLPDRERVALTDALTEAGPARMILHRAETEAALRWGLAQGIRRFQGRHVDAILGAARIVGCAHAPHCTLRQCIERGGGTDHAGRVGCRNLALLDAGAPASLPPARRAAGRSREQLA